MRISRWITAGVAIVAPALLPAQYATPYGPVTGARVRVTAPALQAEPAVGRLRAFAADSLVLDMSEGDAVVRLPVSALATVEVSDGVDRAGSAFRWGLVGAAIGLVSGAYSYGDNSLERMTGSLVSGTLGLGVGAGVGAILAPERWRVGWSAGAGR